MGKRTGMDREKEKDDKQIARRRKGGKEYDRKQHYLETVKRTVTDVGTGWWFRQEGRWREAQAKGSLKEGTKIETDTIHLVQLNCLSSDAS